VRTGYRARQFWQALRSAPGATDHKLVNQVLSPALAALFYQMQPSEQAHSVRVLRSLLSQGETSHDLQVAALLHDAGKARCPLRLWERVEIVLAQALFPRQVARWGEGDPQGWRRPFVAARRHPEWGAQMAAEAGASPLTANLIRRHQDLLPPDPTHLPEDTFLLRLQQFDDHN